MKADLQAAGMVLCSASNKRQDKDIKEDETQRRGRNKTISACGQVASLEGLSMIDSTMIDQSLGYLMYLP